MSEVPVNATGSAVAGTNPPSDLSLAPKLAMMSRKAIEDARKIRGRKKHK